MTKKKCNITEERARDLNLSKHDSRFFFGKLSQGMTWAVAYKQFCIKNYRFCSSQDSQHSFYFLTQPAGVDILRRLPSRFQDMEVRGEIVKRCMVFVFPDSSELVLTPSEYRFDELDDF